MATSIALMLDSHSSSESDYGSDFSIEEEGIVNQLLENLRNNNTTPPNNPANTASSWSPAQIALHADTNAKIADEQSILLPSYEVGDQHRVAGLPVQPEDAGKTKTPAINRGEYSSDSNTRPTTHALPPMLSGGVQYPDRTFPKRHLFTYVRLTKGVSN
ncbi:hypothetical protein M434DRAFT_215698 [Hypoxylon sp. CO27-5]|nr:hypothetical protein M434DRAFT_215698 [Hypoxylon sp. CO27-5]